MTKVIYILNKKSLKDTDDELFDILEKEKERQYKGLELIASEVKIKN
jgi:glycine/serine hydroxymethyltransferase